MSRCLTLAMVLSASIVIYKYGSRGQPIFTVLKWRAVEELRQLAGGTH